MNKKIILLLIFFLTINCSFNSQSKFWTKETKIKKRDENLIAIVIERNSNKVTKDIYINAKEILIPRL